MILLLVTANIYSLHSSKEKHDYVQHQVNTNVFVFLVKFQLHQENRKKGKKREKSVDEDDEEVKREKLNKV